MAEGQETVKTEAGSRVKFNFLRNIEQEVQAEWEREKIFEYDAPADGDNKAHPKYMATFPYPYMNGRLHLGHTFTITKAEFAASYQRLKGKNALFPFGFHCTGMPIKACADRLKREIELYGNPPVFPAKEEQAPANPTPAPAASVDPTAFHSKKSKVAAKSEGPKYQWEIMRSLGVSDSEIPKFADASYWLSFFPPYCKEDLKKIGTGIDWRRAFITTDANPYYDSFVRWQFELLRDLNKVKFGKRYSIYSPKDGQPCMDHDRASGEGVLPQEYTLIKEELIQPYPEKLQSITGKKVYLVPGTLRPETMYGQTNVWILPEGDYGAFEINETDVFICTERAARNLAFQEQSKTPGKVNCLVRLKGWDLIGAAVRPPLSKYPVIYVLPMATISPSKGTGVVTSVPSDSPDDWICFEELRNKPAYRAKFNLDDKMVMPYEIVEIIEVPELGKRAAESVCKSMKINGPKDPKLATAKDEVYTKGFYEGKMVVGEHAGKFVRDAKPLIREVLISNGEAVAYSEPNGEVISRSGDECVVALTDQWYLDYGESQWRTQVEGHLKDMDLFAPECRNKFEATLGWLNQWACSRTYGLGTKLPWDPTYLIESLSDSTIYMAYYAVSHLLQGGVIDGSVVGPAGIEAKQLTGKVWDYIFMSGAYPADCGIPEDTLQKLRNEFQYWYPVDIRVSGKDLINNHLTFFLYNHLAVWNDSSKWPRAIRANGHVLLNGNKMSKSTGNFLTLVDAIELYSADGTRFALADAGDSMDDANFSTEVADNAILKLYTQIKWTEEVLAAKDLRTDDEMIFADRVFESEMNQLIKETEQHYERTNFREAIQTGFFALQTSRDNYRTAVAEKGMKKDLIMKFIEVQAIIMAPITPHFSEHIWKMIGKTGTVRKTPFPVAGAVDLVVLQQKHYLYRILHEFRVKRDLYMKPKKKGSNEPVPAPSKASIAVAANFVEWKQKVLNMLRPFYENKNYEDKAVLAVLTADADLKKNIKKVMPFVVSIKEQNKIHGMSALDVKLPFDEKAFLQSNFDFIKKSVEVNDLEIIEADEQMVNSERSSPGDPSIMFS